MSANIPKKQSIGTSGIRLFNVIGVERNALLLSQPRLTTRVRISKLKKIVVIYKRCVIRL